MLSKLSAKPIKEESDRCWEKNQIRLLKKSQIKTVRLHKTLKNLILTTNDKRLC